MASTLMKDKLLDVWIEQVIPEKRWNTIRPFFYHVFGKCRREQKIILDVAAGYGIEYYYMYNDGFLIQANEYQKELRVNGVRYGNDSGYDVTYSPTSYDWFELVKRGMANMYGGIFAIGNSIRMLGNKEGQLEAVGQFNAVLQKGGMIIIDERNYERFLPHADLINKLGGGGQRKITSSCLVN